MTGPGDSDPPRPRRRIRARRGEGGRLYGEILEAAEALLDASGEDAVTIRAVAQRVGVSNPAVYLHFADRPALLRTVSLRVWDRLDEYMADTGPAAADPFTDLNNRCAAYIRFGLDHPLRYRLVASGPATEATAQVANACFRSMRHAVRRCAGDGAEDAAVTALTRAVCACLHGAVSLLLLQPTSAWPRDRGGYAQDVAALATRGVFSLCADKKR
ncbi:TetR/AcrR family transcriptional regulator [Streptomyces sp. NPDC018026]|uniref:TetR/AcrR family transcriptional regulator n=1 Tax=Streptomyces sp. NPDC018026 TaxID=3365031 RepID=UPI003792628B